MVNVAPLLVMQAVIVSSWLMPDPPPPTWVGGQPEEGRVKQWLAYYKEWPRSWPNETAGFRNYAVKREEEVMRTEPGSQARWEFWLDYVQIRLHPTFTSNGYDVRDVPPSLFRSLSSHFHQNFPHGGTPEAEVPYFITGDRSMVYLPGNLRTELVESVQGIHEEWSGVPLEMTSLYGLRVYQNGSTLAMHVDRANTHVISAVIHVARDYGGDGGPWPIEVIDLHGMRREVELKPGQMLLYESSKCTHGRPKHFRGKYYASAFVHFKPQQNWVYSNEHRVGAVPPHWNIPFEQWEREVKPKLTASLGSSHSDL